VVADWIQAVRLQREVAQAVALLAAHVEAQQLAVV
jgi:hypothetical protein